MSKIALTPNASGTGTLTIAAPNTSTDRTLTLPDETGTVLSSTSNVSVQATQNIPAFQAKAASQVISNNTWTKITFSTEVLDTDGWYDNSTNYRFTPQIAGWYQINFLVQGYYASSGQWIGALYKNGSALIKGPVINYTSSSEAGSSLACIVQFNGSTDYVEVYVQQSSGGNVNVDPADWSHFSGYLVRAT